VSAGSDEIALATVLVIGFALHNATEGFGIIGPLGNVRPSWSWLGLAGLIAGLPVVIGASIG
jgi:zinc transporter, ZIP family